MSKNAENEDVINDIFNSLPSLHISPGPFYQGIRKRKALLALVNDELEAVYHLTESHAPGVRFKAAFQYDKAVAVYKEANPITLKKANVDFPCANDDLQEHIKEMIKRVREMPKQWTIVQLTTRFNQKEHLECNPDVVYTNPIHISVFDCGERGGLPFCVTVGAPIDKIANRTMEICGEMRDIIKSHKHLISNVKVTPEGMFKCYLDKRDYHNAREMINCRLKDLVKQMQSKWLREYRCLLIGKLVDGAVEKKIKTATDEFFQENPSFAPVMDKNRAMVQHFIKGSMFLTLNEQKRAVQQLFPEVLKDDQLKLMKLMKDLHRKLNLHEMKRHPVLLIVDEKLDFLPWEMMDVIENHPVTRMPSLHFTYALFKEHENSIVDGMKIIENPNNGAYILNPDLDLKQMQVRMGNFFRYWMDWEGLEGVAPTSEQFERFLTKRDIFSYHGHGNGAQFLSGEKIQKLRVSAVVLLFGCSSVMLDSLGPQVEMFGQHYVYLIACSPCVVGMLWTVTDFDTDAVTTEFLSQWIRSSKAAHHWKYVNKGQWQAGGEVTVKSPAEIARNTDKCEPELLRVLYKARKAAKHYTTAAACVSRGLPVKIDYESVSN